MPVLMQHPGIPGRSILAEDSPGFIRHATYVELKDPTATTFGRQTHEPQVLQRLYNATGGALVLGRPYAIVEEDDEETSPKLIDPATAGAGAEVRVGVAIDVAADTTWTYAVIQGYVDALCDGGTNDITEGDYLEVDNAGTAFTSDGATRTANSAARFAEDAAYTSATEALKKVYLLGDRPVQIA